MPRSPLAGPIPPRSLRINGVHVFALGRSEVAEHLIWTVHAHERAVERIPGAALHEVVSLGGSVYTLTWPPEFAELPAATYARLLDRGVPATTMRLSRDCRPSAGHLSTQQREVRHAT